MKKKIGIALFAIWVLALIVLSWFYLDNSLAFAAIYSFVLIPILSLYLVSTSRENTEDNKTSLSE